MEDAWLDANVLTIHRLETQFLNVWLSENASERMSPEKITKILRNRLRASVIGTIILRKNVIFRPTLSQSQGRSERERNTDAESLPQRA